MQGRSKQTSDDFPRFVFPEALSTAEAAALNAHVLAAPFQPGRNMNQLVHAVSRPRRSPENPNFALDDSSGPLQHL